jgi:hypothetical protein
MNELATDQDVVSLRIYGSNMHFVKRGLGCPTASQSSHVVIRFRGAAPAIYAHIVNHLIKMELTALSHPTINYLHMGN